MTHGSLFSGIGGFDLAADWMGWENKFHCEWNPFGQKVLHHYWPEAEQFTDITKSNFKKYANQIDILTGGFPCQPYSQAGKRKGKEDERHLWPEMLRAIREIQPSWVVGENVFGLINWSEGLVFHEVQTDLEAEGYEVWPYVLPAAAVNAPHRRDRVWFVAYSNSFSNRRKSEQQSHLYKQGWSSKTNQTIRNKGEQQPLCNIASKRITSHSNSNGLNQCNSNDEIKSGEGRFNAQCNIEQMGKQTTYNTKSFGLSTEMAIGKLDREIRFKLGSKPRTWESFPSVSPICNGDDGISNRLDSITFPKWRNESIKAGGNAIVPQVVYQIFKSIQQYEEAIMQSL
jgi:DNA (cytosine-5)-methyltransferase 1